MMIHQYCEQVDNRTGEKLIFRRSGMALPPVLGQDTDSDAGLFETFDNHLLTTNKLSLQGMWQIVTA